MLSVKELRDISTEIEQDKQAIKEFCQSKNTLVLKKTKPLVPEWEKQLKNQQQRLDQLKMEPVAEQLIGLGTEAINHLQIQIDAIREVLVESGYTQLSPLQVPEPLEQPQKIQDEPMFATPQKIRDLKKQHAPSPKLEDLGLSTLSLDLLKPKVSFSSIDSPRAPSLSHLETVKDTRLSDTNSLFSELMRPISFDEYQRLDDITKSQFTLKSINEIVNEVNDLITDKRFMGDMDQDAFTMDELVQATKMEMPPN